MPGLHSTLLHVADPIPDRCPRRDHLHCDNIAGLFGVTCMYRCMLPMLLLSLLELVLFGIAPEAAPKTGRAVEDDAAPEDDVVVSLEACATGRGACRGRDAIAAFLALSSSSSCCFDALLPYSR